MSELGRGDEALTCSRIRICRENRSRKNLRGLMMMIDNERERISF
jgi:hypothetical protein